MKNLMFMSMVLAGALTINQGANAMRTSRVALLVRSMGQDEKTKIKKEELPEPIQKKLSGDGFKGWVVVTAYKLGGGDYQVELKKGDTTQVLKFDKDGNVK